MNLKLLILSTLLITTIDVAKASLGVCPLGIVNNNSTSNTINFLRKHTGKFSLGSCLVELHVCDTTINNSKLGGNLAADMLIVDNEGNERYIPFFVSDFKNLWSKDIIFLDKTNLGYRFKDKNYDDSTGTNEKLEIILSTKADSNNLDFIEVYYTSEIDRKYNNKKWTVCGTERENFAIKHPNTHFLKSKWWWLTHPGTK
jgi:hypothetical protein